MKIKFRQTGGFAGLAKSIEIDTEQIATDEADRLKSLVNQSSFFDVPQPISQTMPDQELYSITVESQGRSHQLHLSRSSVPGQLKALVDCVAQLAKYEKRK
ncbi:protealysin inhibitor emfourin [Lyngbya aestuarii]|uniref:protealysin inhibitor emfourin n=1 Tax=Lyngbya aestuarii TaxID=118322 RepID=UPI00403D7C70